MQEISCTSGSLYASSFQNNATVVYASNNAELANAFAAAGNPKIIQLTAPPGSNFNMTSTSNVLTNVSWCIEGLNQTITRLGDGSSTLGERRHFNVWGSATLQTVGISFAGGNLSYGAGGIQVIGAGARLAFYEAKFLRNSAYSPDFLAKSGALDAGGGRCQIFLGDGTVFDSNVGTGGGAMMIRLDANLTTGVELALINNRAVKNPTNTNGYGGCLSAQSGGTVFIGPRARMIGNSAATNGGCLHVSGASISVDV